MAKTIKIQRLTPQRIKQLVAETKNFPSLIYVSPIHWLKFHTVYQAELDGHFAGACALITYQPSWLKIGPIALLSKYQGLGLGRKLLTKIVTDHSHHNLLIFSSNPRIHQLCLSLKFKPVSFWQLPYSIWLAILSELLHHLSLKYILDSIKKNMSGDRKSLKFFVILNQE